MEKQSNKGITLIALVITIIVLLILAGVSISMLTGKNGILTQVETAKIKTDEVSAKEAVEMEVAGSFDENGYNKDIAIRNFKNNLGISEDKIIDNGDGTLTVEYQGYKFNVGEKGKVTLIGKADEVSSVKKVSEVTTSYADKNTTVVDDYNNTFVLPEGFKVRVDSTTNNADTVNEGIVIEDEKGNQFVWIPVGNVYTDLEKTEENKKKIELKRYIFNEDGTIDEKLTKTEPSEQIKTTNKHGNIFYFTEKTKDQTTANAHAKDIVEFIDKANSNHGYYVGRYEAGVVNGTLDTSGLTYGYIAPNDNWTGYQSKDEEELELVCKSEQQVWNYITQKKASNLSQSMYTGKTYESDLMNSYAWGTAIVFIQECGTKTGHNKYSMQIGQSTDTSSLASTGKGVLSSKNAVDEQCNIYDMAGNAYEWTTETIVGFNAACHTGGNYISSDDYTSYRGFCGSDEKPIVAENRASFRPILYLQIK